MDHKYCCTRFGIRHEASHEDGLNLRIVKSNPDRRMDINNIYRFYITPGYQPGQECIKTINIRYCPFCGTNLYDFYRDDDYINEAQDTFDIKKG